MFCVSVHAAELCDALGAYGLRGEHRDQPPQTDAGTQRRVWRTPPLRGVAHPGRSRHQLAGLSPLGQM